MKTSAFDPQVAEILSTRWEEIYQLLLDEASKRDVNPARQQTLVPSSTYECKLHSIFPFTTDEHPSASVNIQNGLWRDLSACNLVQWGSDGGNIVMFIALLRARQLPNGQWIWNYTQAERWLKLYLGIVGTIDEEWYMTTRIAIEGDEFKALIQGTKKKWSLTALRALGIGFDIESGKIVLPLFDNYLGKKTIINAKMYLPGATDYKMTWRISNIGGNIAFPFDMLPEDDVFLVEGEPDVISLRSININAVSGVLGAGTPVPDGHWEYGRNIFICMDSDAAGRKAEGIAAEKLKMYAKSIMIIRLPEWEGKPKKADISDYIYYLFTSGMKPEAVKIEVQKLKSTAQPVDTDYESIRHGIVHIPLNKVFAGGVQALPAMFNTSGTIVQLESGSHQLPRQVEFSCDTVSFGRTCETCLMRTRAHGNMRFTTSDELITVISSLNNDTAMTQIRKAAGIPSKCTFVRGHQTSSETYAKGYIRVPTAATTSIDENRSDSDTVYPFITRENDNEDLPRTGSSLNLVSKRLITFNQTNVIFANKRSAVQNEFDEFVVWQDDKAELQKFCTADEPEAILNSLSEVADDIANNFTGIVGRNMLTALFRLVYFSMVEFHFNYEPADRGWIEACVIGDTRTGKSKTARGFQDVFGYGEVVDWNSVSQAGLTAGISYDGGVPIIRYGIFPRNDKYGVVMLDEVTASLQTTDLFKSLAATRSSGEVTIDKIKSGKMNARCRLLVFANPITSGHRVNTFAEMGTLGCEEMMKLLRTSQSVARFDLGYAITAGDVPLNLINSRRKEPNPKYSKELHRKLLRFAWSRKIDQVTFTEDATDFILAETTLLANKYNCRIPLVDEGSARFKLARISASIAAQVFSTNEECDIIIVTEAIARAASILWQSYFDSEYFGLDRISSTHVPIIITEENVDMVLLLLQNSVGIQGRAYLGMMIAGSNITESSIVKLCSDNATGQILLNTLVAEECLTPEFGGMQTKYHATQKFVLAVRKFMATPFSEKEERIPN